MEVAAANNSEILREFQQLAERVAAWSEDRLVTIDDVRRAADECGLKYTPGNWMGSVFRGSRWQATGTTVPAVHANSHGRLVRVWRLR